MRSRPRWFAATGCEAAQGLTSAPPPAAHLQGGELRRAGVNVFGMASRKESLMLLVKVSQWEP